MAVTRQRSRHGNRVLLCDTRVFHNQRLLPIALLISTAVLIPTMVNRSGGAKYAPKKKPPKTARREMTNVEKGMILAFFHCLGSIAQVASLVGRPWSTIKSFLIRACERMTVENLPRPGRTPLLSRQQRCTIIWAAKSNRQMTRADFRDRYAPGVSCATGNHTTGRVIGHTLC